MGYDTSFHPVDVNLVATRLLPYIAGHGGDGDLDDLIARAVLLRRVRFRAKSWALGALEAFEKRGIDGPDPDLIVWGRPFFIVADEPGQVVADVLRYLATPPDDVDELAREMVARIDPGLAGTVRPDPDGTLPDDAELARSLSRRMRVLRASAAALAGGVATVRDPDGDEEFEAAVLLAREVPLSVLELAAALTPGWMSRGYTWPTSLCAAAGVPATGFAAPEALFAPLRELFPGIGWFSEPTITENYMVGGLVAPGDVARVRAELSARRDALLEPPGREGWAGIAADNLLKIDEALALAGHLGFGFAEATEVYSGFEGELN
ncbi:serine/threonine-protein kinase [Rugosimonospora acidiphila]